MGGGNRRGRERDARIPAPTPVRIRRSRHSGERTEPRLTWVLADVAMLAKAALPDKKISAAARSGNHKSFEIKALLQKKFLRCQGRSPRLGLPHSRFEFSDLRLGLIHPRFHAVKSGCGHLTLRFHRATPGCGFIRFEFDIAKFEFGFSTLRCGFAKSRHGTFIPECDKLIPGYGRAKSGFGRIKFRCGHAKP